MNTWNQVNDTVLSCETVEVDMGFNGGITGDYSTGKDDYGGYEGEKDGEIGDFYEEMPVDGSSTDDGAGIMTSGLFVYGMIGVALLVSVGLGILFAKLRIKKGFDPYED